MNNELSFILKFINTSGVLVNDIDISNYIKSYSLDDIKFMDEETLMNEARKCSIEAVNIFPIIEQYITSAGEYAYIKEDIQLQNVNYYNQQEIDTGLDGHQNRRVKFIVPFYNSPNDITQVNTVFPSTYDPNPGTNVNIDGLTVPKIINLIPARDYTEEHYYDYDREYIIRKPVYYSVIVDVYKGNINIQSNHIYRGILEIDSYSYDYKTRSLNMSFVDGFGVLIECMEALGTYHSFYQGVYQSGTRLSEIVDIIPTIVGKFYSRLTNVFVFDITAVDSSKSISVIIRGSWDRNEGSFYFNINGFGTSPQINSIELSGSELIPPLNPIPYYINVSGTVYYLYCINVFCQFDAPNNIMKVIIETLFVENTSWTNIKREYYYEFYVFNTLGLVNYSYAESITDWYNYLYERDGIIAYGFTEIYFNHNFHYSEGFDLINTFPADDYSFDAGNFPYIIQNAIPFTFPLMYEASNVGFNRSMSVKEVMKTFMLTLGMSVSTRGATVSGKRYAPDVNDNIHELDDYQILSINKDTNVYEKPDLQVLESLADWERRGFKPSVSNNIGIVPDTAIISTKYKITFIDKYSLPVNIGHKIRFNLTDNSTTRQVLANISSIGYESENKVKLEVYVYA